MRQRPWDHRQTRDGDRILARAFTVARRAEPDVVVTTSRTVQHPAAALLESAAGAALLVVGMGRSDLPGGVLIGSVALDVSGRAPWAGGSARYAGSVMISSSTLTQRSLR